MSIEPAILLMMNSATKYPEMTAQLVEFLCSASESIFPQQEIRASIKRHIQLVFRLAVQYRVIPYVVNHLLCGPPVIYIALLICFHTI
jgi:hypothetical protein